MSLANIQSCHMDAIDRAEGKFTVTVHFDDGNGHATLECDSEGAARSLRDAIRDHAARLRSVADFRRDSRPQSPAAGATDAERASLDIRSRLADTAAKLQAAERRVAYLERANAILSDAATEAADALQRGIRKHNDAMR